MRFGNFDRPQLVCNEMLVDSNGGDSIVDSKFVDKEIGGEAPLVER